MPFLIKSSNGKRSCTMVTNGNKESDLLREQVIEALRGLTIKLEVKIADVLVSDTEQLTNGVKTPPKPFAHSTRSVETNSAPISSKPPVVAKALQQSHAPEPDRAPQAPEPPKASQRNPPKEDEAPTKPIRLIPDSVQQAAHRQAAAETITKTIEKPTREEPKEAPKTAPKPPIIKGDLEIGATINTCCIAYDDSTSPPTAFISHDSDSLIKITKTIAALVGEISNLPKVSRVGSGDIVYGKSTDDNNWYRAVVESSDESSANLYYFDWGLKEKLSLDRIKHLIHPDLGLSSYPACAVKVLASPDSQVTLDNVCNAECPYPMIINSYDDSTDTYLVTILNP